MLTTITEFAKRLAKRIKDYEDAKYKYEDSLINAIVYHIRSSMYATDEIVYAKNSEVTIGKVLVSLLIPMPEIADLVKAIKPYNPDIPTYEQIKGDHVLWGALIKAVERRLKASFDMGMLVEATPEIEDIYGVDITTQDTSLVVTFTILA